MLPQLLIEILGFKLQVALLELSEKHRNGLQATLIFENLENSEFLGTIIKRNLKLFPKCLHIVDVGVSGGRVD